MAAASICTSQETFSRTFRPVAKGGIFMALALVLLAMVYLPTSAAAETVVLRGGAAVEGQLLSYDAKGGELRLRLESGGVLLLRRADVERIIFVDPGLAA